MYYLGIDGGGTKTRGLLSDERGHILSDAQTGPSNPNDLTPEETVSVLNNLIRELIDRAGLTHELYEGSASLSLFAGISGALNHKDTLTHLLTSRLADLVGVTRMSVGSDVELILSELPIGNGACIIIGTGSACFVRCDNTLTRIGGWGYLLDSGGSGYDIGRAGLEAALRAHDSRGNPTSLSNRLAIHLGSPVHQSLSTIYAQGKPFIAACAPCVFAAAEEDHDPVANEILDRNAGAIAELCEAAERLLRAHDSARESVPTVILGGGIAQKSPAYLARVRASLTTPSSVHLQTASQEPVMGALHLAGLP